MFGVGWFLHTQSQFLQSLPRVPATGGGGSSGSRPSTGGTVPWLLVPGSRVIVSPPVPRFSTSTSPASTRIGRVVSPPVPAVGTPGCCVRILPGRVRIGRRVGPRCIPLRFRLLKTLPGVTQLVITFDNVSLGVDLPVDWAYQPERNRQLRPGQK